MRFTGVLSLLAVSFFGAIPLYAAQASSDDSVAKTVLPAWESRASTLFPAYEAPAPPTQSFLDSDASPSGKPEIHVPHEVDRHDYKISQRCASGEIDGDACKFHWKPALLEQLEYLTIETSWNLSTNYWVRYYTFHGHWLQDWFQADAGFKFSRWNDANPIIDDYVGHPMMGAITMDIFIQNDPRGRSIEFQNTKAYWHSRLRALLYSAIYSAEWKLGPVSEASFGRTGGFDYYDKNAGKVTNGTGTVGLVVTPLGGWVWAIGEDFMDYHVISKLDWRTGNSFYLFAMSWLNPCRSFANLMRYHAPWYRDSRQVPSIHDRVYVTQSDVADLYVAMDNTTVKRFAAVSP
jgi:hypothetical protein